MNAYARNEEGLLEDQAPLEPVVAVVMADPKICKATCALLEAHGVVARPCHDPASLLFLMRDELLDGIVLDTDFSGMDALAFFGRLIMDPESPRLVLLTSTMTASEAVVCLRQGAVSVLEKPVLPSALVDDVRAAVALTCDARHKEALRLEGLQMLEVLSPREKETFDFLVAGLATQAIADTLGIALQTAKVHRSRVMQKLGLRSVAHLVRLDAQTQGLDLSLGSPRELDLSARAPAGRPNPEPTEQPNRFAPTPACA